MSEPVYLGIDIGGTKCAVVLADSEATIVAREELPTGLGEEGRNRTIEQLKSAAVRMAAQCRIRAIGIASGGPLDAERGMILCPPNLGGWENLPIVEIFQEELRVPTCLENDANAAALAEWRFGAGQGVENLVYLTYSTGIGAGIILNGRLYRGTSDQAGEVGHVRLAGDGPEGHNKRGSFEGFCSGPGMAKMMSSELASLAEDIGPAEMQQRYKDPRVITGKDVADWAKAGDPLALRAVVTSGEYLGRGMAVLVDILNPELIVVGGMGVRLGDLVLDPARKTLAEEALASGVAVCRVVPAALGERTGDIGAICAALECAARSSPGHDTGGG
jgi:glucokinase